MKVLIVSDSHGLHKELLDMKERHKDEVKAMIHCGDSELSVHDKGLQGFIAVKGNMDFRAPELPDEAIEHIGETCFYITHGHLYNVKMSFLSISFRGEEIGADIVCFGHSHVAQAFERNGRIFINPGSIRLPKGRQDKTYAICDIQNKEVTVHFYTIEGEELTELRNTFFRGE
ncbi:metallophosphoesterase [Fictibacillus sp. Mic-4]|uniref:metallophosphoesterase n=1 Tax=Fictibacillus TaxID=1329200 RepID=UPI00041E276F|nr:metallophosphoesterase [Fictibacillus gelatini]